MPAAVRFLPCVIALPALIACSERRAAAPSAPRDLQLAAFTATPIPSFSAGQAYKGLEGGLYGGGSNTPPAPHDAAGIASANSVQPINGKIVVLCIGFSSVQRECARFQAEEMGLVPDSRNKVKLPPGTMVVEVRGGIVIVNGGQAFADMDAWDDPGDLKYGVVRDDRLPPYTESDVQVVWLQLNLPVGANSSPPTLPSPDAFAWDLRDGCPAVISALRTRYPNLRQVFLSAKQYTGYSVSGDHREPYSYEGGFGLRECILSHQGPPFLGWGPYLWDPTWATTDYSEDGIHPNDNGLAKVAALLRTFLTTSPYTRWWDYFISRAQCENGVDDDADGKIDYPADPECADAGDASEGRDPPSSITLSATGIANGVRRTVKLQWGGASGTRVEIWRNGAQSGRTANDGRHSDRLLDGTQGTVRYKICQSGGTPCSPERSVTF